MLNSILSNFKKFREQIYSAIQYRADAFMDLLDSLCSNTTADTPVKLSLNAHHRRTYNSITDVVTEFHKGGPEQSDNLTSILTEQAIEHNQHRGYILLVTDCTPAPRPYSKRLSDRGIIYSPNPVKKNKPIAIGHKYSITGFLPPKAIQDSPWVLPLITERVHTKDDEALVGAQQLQKIIDITKSNLSGKLVVNTVDSSYCKPEYIHQLHSADAGNDNLVTIVRAKSNRVIWRKSTEKKSAYSGKRGHDLWYGNKFDFKNSTTWHTPDQSVEISAKTKKGKECLIKITAWDDMLMRQKRGVPMNEHPFTLYIITMTGNNGEYIFQKPQWLMVFGKRRNELTIEQVRDNYLQRYDIEHFFKFDKNNLLAGKLQTTETKHEENWWSICSLAYSCLFVAKAASGKLLYPWEKYLPEAKEINRIPSATQVQRSFHELTCTIGTPANPPKVRGNALGRATGARQTKRKRFEVIIKSKKPDKKLVA